MIWSMGKKKKDKKVKTRNELAVMPAANDKSIAKFTAREDELLWVLAEGRSPMQVAKQLHPQDKTKQASARRKIYLMFQRVDLQDELAARLKLIQILGLGPAVKALNRKAAAGRVDAIKLAFESSGFHNPRDSKHEHSGEIEIVIKNAPRPERVQEEYLGGDRVQEIMDAEVVED